MEEAVEETSFELLDKELEQAALYIRQQYSHSRDDQLSHTSQQSSPDGREWSLSSSSANSIAGAKSPKELEAEKRIDELLFEHEYLQPRRDSATNSPESIASYVEELINVAYSTFPATSDYTERMVESGVGANATPTLRAALVLDSAEESEEHYHYSEGRASNEVGSGRNSIREAEEDDNHHSDSHFDLEYSINNNADDSQT
jgi:hypothetical protein